MSLPKPDSIHPAVRHLPDDRDMVVDPDAAGADLAGRPERAVDAAGPRGRGQPVRGVVGQLDRLVVGTERVGRQHRPEHLVPDDLAARIGVRDERGPVTMTRA